MNDEPFVFSYTRADALADGVLVDVSTMARDAGFRVPIALTAAVWQRYVKVPRGAECQDEAGRLWDILMMLHWAAKRNGEGRQIAFCVYVQNDHQGPRPISLKAICGPGDQGETVVTVMLPHED